VGWHLWVPGVQLGSEVERCCAAIGKRISILVAAAAPKMPIVRLMAWRPSYQPVPSVHRRRIGVD
jgi:hypothetical protein